MRCLNEQRTDYIHALFARFTVKQCLVLLNLRGLKVKAKYLYSYDDVKVQDAGGTNGYDYLGSRLTLVKTSGTQTPETDFGGGIIRRTQVMYFENDHLGSIRTVLNTAGTVIERNDYYPFGMRHANASHMVTANNRYKFNGKEDQTVGTLGLLDYGARMYDAFIGRWLGVDPLADSYYSISPYAYCANNPVLFVDPNGMMIDLSGMSEEERKAYEEEVERIRKQSQLFNAMYSSLVSSKNVFKVIYGSTTVMGSDPVLGQFNPNEKGGGVVTFLEGKLNIDTGTLSEEFFHAYQHENSSKYAKGDFNREFEAKVAATAIGMESGSGYGEFGGMLEFQKKIGYGEYGEGPMQISPTNVMSIHFLDAYKKAANIYAKFNIENNLGNVHYKKSTTVASFSLQQMVKKAYGN